VYESQITYIVLCDHSKAQRKVWYTLSQPKMELKVAHHPQELMV